MSTELCFLWESKIPSVDQVRGPLNNCVYLFLLDYTIPTKKDGLHWIHLATRADGSDDDFSSMINLFKERPRYLRTYVYNNTLV